MWQSLLDELVMWLCIYRFILIHLYLIINLFGIYKYCIEVPKSIKTHITGHTLCQQQLPPNSTCVLTHPYKIVPGICFQASFMICSYPDIPISVVIIEGRGVLRWARNRELRKFNKVWILKSDFFFLVFKWFRLKAVRDNLSIHLAKIKLAVLKTLIVVLTKQWSMQYNLNLF